MSINIRLASLEDIPALRGLIDESVRTLSVRYYTEQQIRSALTHIFGVDTQLILDGTYFVAETNGRIVGAGGWSKRATLFGGDQLKGTGPDRELDPARDAARIRAFYVHPEWSRKGISRRVLQMCEEAMLQAGFRRAELMATLPGEPLYSAMGYSRIEYIESAMPDGELLTGYRMEKHLTKPVVV